MSTRSRQEYFVILRERYRKITSKSQRTELINEAIRNTGLHRKSVLRALLRRRHPEGGAPRLGRPRKYTPAAVDLLKRLYRSSEFACSDRLKAMIPVLLSQWRGPLDAELIFEVKAMSAASMDRYLKQYRGIQRRRSNTGTRPGSRLFKKLIPIKALGNIAPRPGFLQADTVAHCGGNMSGEFIWSLTTTDEKCGWTENRAFFGKHAKNTLPALESIHHALPFELVGINVDNGSEFLNCRVYEYFQLLAQRKVIPFPMSRSRPYRKNDNCHVEQKNWTSVRQLFGYDRFENRELVPLMNEIYRVQNLISNYFLPQYKLKAKVRSGAKIKKTYDEPKTPYQRLLDDPSVSDDQKNKLRETYSSLNYFDLVNEREALLARFEQIKKELNSNKTG